MKRLFLLMLPVLLFLQAEVFAAALFAGYGKTPWGVDPRVVAKSFPKGNISKVGPQEFYKQLAPNSEMKQRNFAFSANKLVAVSVTFAPAYVKKTGIEKLLAKQKKLYGEGVVDRTGAPHMVTYRWQDAGIRITFAYAPKNPEMTIIMYEKI